MYIIERQPLNSVKLGRIQSVELRLILDPNIKFKHLSERLNWQKNNYHCHNFPFQTL